MNKPLMPEEVALLTKPVMTRRDKLLRFAAIVRSANQDFGLYHNLETYNPMQLLGTSIQGSAFEAAAADPILRDAGLTRESVRHAQSFFELTQHQLHEFSCDCGGAITNSDMANRIEKLAG